MTLPLPHGDVQPNEVRENFEEIARQFPVQAPLVTAMPATAADGTEVQIVADSTNGIVWRFRYRSASSSAYKWEFIGGHPMRAVVATAESTTSTSYTNLATTHSLTLPALAGDFRFDLGAACNSNTAANGARMAVKYSAAEAVDAEGVINQDQGNQSFMSVATSLWITVTAASQVITARYRANGGGTAQFSTRYLAVTPVRVA